MLSIDDATPAHRVSFVLDALGRHASQTIGTGGGSVTTAYAYLGTSNTVSSMSVGAAVTTTSLIDAIGNRLGQGTASGFGGYLIADLHGNIAGAVSAGSSPALLSAYRYDAYGETCGSWTADSGSLNVPWRFGGRLLESISGTTTDLYDFGARSYDPSLGAFTSFDSVSGSAGNPLTLNRYLYANANPATLVDPDGHAAWQNSCHYDAEDCAVIAKAKANARIAGPGHVCADNSHWCGNAPPVVSTCLSTNTCNVDPGAAQDGGSVKPKSSSGHSGGGSWDGPPPGMVQAPCPGAAPNPNGQTPSCPDIYITIEQAKERYGTGLPDWAATMAGGETYAGAALLCLLGGELDGVGCLPFIGMTVYTFVNAGNNLLHGNLNPFAGWNTMDAVTGGLGTLVMGLLDVGIVATLGLSFGFGVASDLISQQGQHPGQFEWGHAFCSGLTSAWSASAAEQKAIGNNPKQAIIWDTMNGIAGMVACEGVHG
jgi:RHS repeat-associated protein